jgi:hypothetical protein
MEKFAKYLATVDGTKTWAEVGPAFDEAFHPDAVIVTADAEFDKEQWADMAKGLVEKGAVAADFRVTGQEGNSYYYEVTVTVADEAMHMIAKGTLEDGRLVRVEPVDPDLYTALVERSK